MTEQDERDVAAAPEAASSTQTADAQASEPNEADGANAPAAKKSNKNKKLITVGVVVIVLVLAGAGFWVWHEQPSFCNAICHSPMDAYVESYSEGDAGQLVTQHAEANISCLGCHEAVITTQVAEVMSWIADDYPMTEDGMLATGTEFATEEFCARSGCHDMTDVVESTWGFEGNDEKYNPHSNHQSNLLECSDCHKVHETSTLYCTKCHNLNVPEGWESASE